MSVYVNTNNGIFILLAVKPIVWSAAVFIILRIKSLRRRHFIAVWRFKSLRLFRFFIIGRRYSVTIRRFNPHRRRRVLSVRRRHFSVFIALSLRRLSAALRSALSPAVSFLLRCFISRSVKLRFKIFQSVIYTVNNRCAAESSAFFTFAVIGR